MGKDKPCTVNTETLNAVVEQVDDWLVERFHEAEASDVCPSCYVVQLLVGVIYSVTEHTSIGVDEYRAMTESAIRILAAGTTMRGPRAN